jgi:hypothetical protein
MDLNKNKCELFGMFLGDGCFSKNKRYCELTIAGDISEEREYHESYVIPLFNKEFCNSNYAVKGKAYPKVGVYGFYCFKQEIVESFASLFSIKPGSKENISIPKTILNNKIYLRRVLRGLFDTDGSICFEKNYSMVKSTNKVPRIYINLTSLFLVKQAYKGLQNLGFHPKLSGPYKLRPNEKPLMKIKIYRKADVTRWLTEIGFRNPKHLTKIEVWKRFGFCPPQTNISQRRQILASNKI